MNNKDVPSHFTHHSIAIGFALLAWYVFRELSLELSSINIIALSIYFYYFQKVRKGVFIVLVLTLTIGLSFKYTLTWSLFSLLIFLIGVLVFNVITLSKKW